MPTQRNTSVLILGKSRKPDSVTLTLFLLSSSSFSAKNLATVVSPSHDQWKKRWESLLLVTALLLHRNKLPFPPWSFWAFHGGLYLEPRLFCFRFQFYCQFYITSHLALSGFMVSILFPNQNLVTGEPNYGFTSRHSGHSVRNHSMWFGTKGRFYSGLGLIHTSSNCSHCLWIAWWSTVLHLVMLSLDVMRSSRTWHANCID